MSDKDPWFFTRSQLLKNKSQISGRTLDLGAANENYKSIIEDECTKYISFDKYNSPNVKGDAISLPFKTKSFQTIICTQVFEHIPQPWKAMNEIQRVLNPGGILFLSVPFLYPYHQEPHDYYRYTPDGIRALLNNANLKPEKISSMGGTLLIIEEYLFNTIGNFPKKNAIFHQLRNFLARIVSEDRNPKNTMNIIAIAKNDRAN